MKARIKKLWVKALRSGKYKQTQHTLRDGRKNAYCCLGVLCEVHNQTVGGRWKSNGDYYDTAGILPVEVMEWAGLYDDNPVVPYGKIKETLAGLNDLGRDFNFIADKIEKYL
jgi:hypothetical protein